MSNSTEFNQLETELQAYKEILGKAADTILNEGVSSYPIFVIHQHFVDIGILMVDKNVVSSNWSINASSLEEFMTKQIIQEDKVEDFKEIYKNPEEFYCLFVLSELGARYIFLPR